jgi:hypothetical protein
MTARIKRNYPMTFFKKALYASVSGMLTVALPACTSSTIERSQAPMVDTSDRPSPTKALEPEVLATSKLSETELALLQKEVAEKVAFSKGADVSALVINKWCNFSEAEMLDRAVKALAIFEPDYVAPSPNTPGSKLGDMEVSKSTEIEIAAIGFRRVCAKQRPKFATALDKAKTNGNQSVVQQIQNTAYSY